MKDMENQLILSKKENELKNKEIELLHKENEILRKDFEINILKKQLQETK